MPEVLAEGGTHPPIDLFSGEGDGGYESVTIRMSGNDRFRVNNSPSSRARFTLIPPGSLSSLW